MRLLSPTSAPGALVRLLAAAALISVIAVGAPMHSHDLAVGNGDGGSPQKAPCAACVTNASPGLALDRADIAPQLQSVDVVVASEASVVALPLPARSGRAPPAV